MHGPKITCSQCSSNTSRSRASRRASVHSTAKYSVRLPSRFSSTVMRVTRRLTLAHPRGGQGAPVHPRERARHGGPQQPRVRDLEQVLGDPPEILLGRHPAGPPPVEARQIDRARVGAQGAVAAQVDVAVEVAHDQLAQAPVHRLAIAQPREVRLGDGAPVPAAPEHRHHVIGVLHRLQVQQERREAEHPQRRRREHRALQAMRGALAQHPARRPRGARPGDTASRRAPAGCRSGSGAPAARAARAG